MRNFVKFLKFANSPSKNKVLFAAVAGVAGVALTTSHSAGATTTDSSTTNSAQSRGANFTFTPQLDSKPSFLDNHKTLTAFGTLPEAKIIRKIPDLIAKPGEDKLNLRLYQFQNCPFCCKVRAFLDYYGFGYEVVEVNSVTKRELKFSEYKKVPVIVVQNWNNKQLNDSSFIVSFLRTYFVDPERSLDEIKSFYPIFVYDSSEDPKKQSITYENDNKYFVMFNDRLKTKTDIGSRKEEREWRRWVDEHFVHTISPNIYRSFGESLESFKWFSKNGDWPTVFPAYERLFIEYVGALVMYFVGKKLKNKHNLKMDVRESLYDACDEWIRAIGQHRKFMGGDRPNLADLAVYGALTSFEGCEAFQDLLKNTEIGPWFRATKSAVEARLGVEEFGKI